MNRRYAKKKTRIGRVILLIVIVMLAAAGCYGLGQARNMMGMARELKADVKTVASGFAAGDPKQCYAALDEMDADAELASAELKKPIWKIASAVPVAGSDVRSAGVLIGVLRDCSESMIRPAAELLEDVSGEGLSATEKAEKLLAFYQSAMPSLSDAAERMSGVKFRVIDRDGKISGYLNTFAAAEQILSRMSDSDGAIIKIDIIPCQCTQLTGTHTGVSQYAMKITNHCDRIAQITVLKWRESL